MPAALNGHSCQFVQKRVALQTVSHLRNGLDDIRVTAHCLLRPWAVHKQDFFGSVLELAAAYSGALDG